MTKLEKATLANGCFWCSDAVYREVKGIQDVRVGFTGGTVKNPGYREVVRELTGHAEAVQLTFDPAVISYSEILFIFFSTHDPTSLNRQGNDSGTHYRSAIFYHDEEQKETAEEILKQLNEAVYHQAIVTELKPVGDFYEADKEHQDFYNLNREFPYCRFVIDPKLQKLRREFSDKLRS